MTACNTMYEMYTFNMAKEEHNLSTLFEFLSEVNKMKLTSQVHPFYLHQINQLLQCIQNEFKGTDKQDSYQFKANIAQVRDLSILLSAQHFEFENLCEHHHQKTFSVCCYIFQVIKNTLPWSLLFSILKTLSSIWNGEVKANFQANHQSHCLGLPRSSTENNNNNLLLEQKDYIDYLLLFFHGFMYGNRNLHKDLQDVRKIHCNEWVKTYNGLEVTCDVSVEEHVNFIYSVLLPFLDNLGIISVEQSNYDILFRVFRCLFASAGCLHQFYELINKYQFKFINDSSTEVKIENNQFLKRFLLNFDTDMTKHITKVLMKDLCHLYGYDNIWHGSKIFGNLMYSLTSGQRHALGNDNENKVVLDVDFRRTKSIPDNIGKNLSSLSGIALTSNDLWSILKYLVMSSYGYCSSVENLALKFWTKIFIRKKDISFERPKTTMQQWLGSLFDIGIEVITNFLRDIDFPLTCLDPFNSNVTDDGVLVTFTVYPHKCRLVKLFDSNKCSPSLLLLLGITTCALKEGFLNYHAEKFVRNIPSISPLTHWCDKDTFKNIVHGNIANMNSEAKDGWKIMTDLLSISIHEEWTPIIVGLLQALAKLVCSHQNLHEKFRLFYQYVNRVYKLEDALETPSHSDKQTRFLSPSRQLLEIQYLYMINHYEYYFIPLFRSAALFYGGMVMLSKANRCICKFSQPLPMKPSKSESGGYKQLVKCFDVNCYDDNMRMIKHKCVKFLANELFFKYQHARVLKNWDFSYPFVIFFKKPENYRNVVLKTYIQWMK